MRQHFKPILLLVLALLTQTISADDVGILEKEITVASNELLAKGRWASTTRLTSGWRLKTQVSCSNMASSFSSSSASSPGLWLPRQAEQIRAPLSA
jgi:hypothetical protein